MDRKTVLSVRLSADELEKLKILKGRKPASEKIRELILQKFEETKKETADFATLLTKLNGVDLVKMSEEIRQMSEEIRQLNQKVDALQVFVSEFREATKDNLKTVANTIIARLEGVER